MFKMNKNNKAKNPVRNIPEQNSVIASNHSFACALLITIHTFERRGEQARKNRK